MMKLNIRHRNSHIVSAVKDVNDIFAKVIFRVNMKVLLVSKSPPEVSLQPLQWPEESFAKRQAAESMSALSVEITGVYIAAPVIC